MNINLLLFLTLSISTSLNLSFLNQFVSAQINQIRNNDTINDTSQTLAPDYNTSSLSSSNTSGIMHNTSGIIDDAFDALKDSFGSIFGK